MPETLFVIDAYAQIFRAFFAIRSLKSSVTGEPTNAVFGFTGMLMRLLSEHSPSHVIIALDAPGPTFRDEMFSDYKATRAPTPDDLVAQVPRVLEVASALGIPYIGVPGLEADDVIACLVHRVTSDPQYQDLTVRIVSKDKDLEQLLSKNVGIFDVHTGASMDVDGLKSAKNIRPDQVIDYLTLIGDNVDNVPGIPGIGPKTAATLLEKYDSLDGILANVDQLSPKQRDALKAAAPNIEMSRKLVTLVCDHPFEFSISDARLAPVEPERVLPLFKELGFGRHQDSVRKLAEQQAAIRTAAEEKANAPQQAFDFSD